MYLKHIYYSKYVAKLDKIIEKKVILSEFIHTPTQYILERIAYSKVPPQTIPKFRNVIITRLRGFIRSMQTDTNIQT